MAYWSTIEMNVAIILACIPTLKPLMSRVCPWVLGSAAVPDGTSQDSYTALWEGESGGGSPKLRHFGGGIPR